MNTTRKLSALLISLSILTACTNRKPEFDASGSFEAEETIISAGATGTIEAFSVEEGQALKAGTLVGYIDSVQLYLRKKQLEAQAKAIAGRKPDVSLQLAALQAQLATARKEQTRIGNLVKANAATTKQLDDINSTVDILGKQILAQQSSLEISSTGINKDVLPIDIQVREVNDQLEKCRIINPIDGTVLTKYAEAHEMATAGKALYKIANLSTIILRAYVPGSQLPLTRLNEKVTVLTDDGKGGLASDTGRISWISDKAEFTPKTIQTKDERANMVYAIKIKVANDGRYKIGMYGEIKFQK